MASTTSVMSLLVLLLATYCYSVPIGQGFDATTSAYQFSTGKTMVPREAMSMSSAEDLTTVESMTGHKRGADDYLFTTSRMESATHMSPKRANSQEDSDEFTSVRSVQKPMNSGESSGKVHKSRGFTDDKFTTMESFTQVPRGVEPESSEQGHKTHDFNDDKFTTMESFTQFVPRGVEPESSEQGHKIHDFNDDKFTTIESFTKVPRGVEPESGEDKPSHTGLFHGMEMTTMFAPSSSVDSFGKSTGILREESTDKKPMTSESGEHEHVQPTERPMIRTEQHITKTETIIPGKITETKIFAEIPSRTYLVSESETMQTPHISQGSTLLLFLLAALSFCTFLMTSIIAFVNLLKSLKTQSRVTEMEADLNIHYQQFEK